MSLVYKPSDEEFINLINNSRNYSDALVKLGLHKSGGSSTILLKRRIKELNCCIKHFSRSYSDVAVRHNLKDVLVENSKYTNRKSLKNRLINDGILKYQCIICLNDGNWLNNKLVLQLDHINGVSNDNRIENLRLLCPNCHSQTDNYAGKNIQNGIN